MSRTDYHDFHTLIVDPEKAKGLYVWPSIRKSGLTEKYFQCCKQATDHPNKLVVLEIEFYCSNDEVIDLGV